MMDPVTIGGALTSLKTAADIAKALLGIHDQAMIRASVIELQSAILAAQSDALATQSAHLAALQHIKDLNAELEKVQAWQMQKQRYRLVQLPGNVFVYELFEHSGDEPQHQICANCFEASKRSILQRKAMGSGLETLHCPACGTDVRAGNHVPTTAPVVRLRAPGPNGWMGR